MKTVIDEGDDWFRRFRDGDSKAMGVAFDKFYRPVSYFALKILRDDSYAEDIVLEVFRKAWDNRGKLDSPRHLSNFLYLVTRNDCISYLRSGKLSQIMEDEWSRLAETNEGVGTALDIERVQTGLIQAMFEQMEKLPGGDILRMSYIEGKTTREIATELKMTENNVYVIKCRSLKALRTKLSKQASLFLLLLMVSF
jgi:RNA polymerase sigma factor (sigma-70 family)